MTPALRKGLGAIALAALALAACASAPPGPIRLTIVHTNDLHGHVENFAAVAAAARQEEERNPRTLFLDAGDCISGTPVSTLFKGRPIFEIMNLMGYDAAALGNHEFDHGWPLIAEFRELAAFPLLCANAKDPEGALLGDLPYQVFDLQGVKVGVIGIITADVPTLTQTSATKGCSFERAVDAAKRLVPEVRPKCDILVLLTHCGVEVDAAIAGAVPGIDLIVGGHTHTELKEPLVGAVHGTRIVQARSYGTRVGVVEIEWDPDARRVGYLRGRLIEIDRETMPNDADVQRVVDAWEARVSDQVDHVIGKTGGRLSKERLRGVLERIYVDLTGADFGYQNLAGIRSVIEPGEITIREVWETLPFDNELVKLRLRGDQLPAFMRKQLGAKLDPAKDYVVATNSYVADQQKKYFGTETAPVEDTGLLLRDAVVDWVREHRGFVAARGERDLEKGERR